ncbi:MAG: lysine--tRNA ligase [Candidatus Sungbacteria bacterium]|uniref:Lysine--tRNA ligase n=1 Tax=Candidatus Sungiibacteriota bacterium TaxID=2750080 RepID=A0A932YVJ0_9BACT|nr:lysine--tRNA ligase [Candidatus Sungbacteria bacterium]
MALGDIRSDRLAKLERYEAAGGDSYPASVRRNFLVGDAVRRFAAFLKSKRAVNIVGRLHAMREHGGVTFGDLEDASGTIQLAFDRNELGEAYDAALAVIDIGDFLEVAGAPFKTKRGEPTLKVSSWRIIAKSLRPLPEKWHGLKDVEERFRKRYLDLLMNPEVRDRFRHRTAVIRAIRAFFDGEGFLEVETPVLQHLPGGALAKPFKTRHNALGIDLYLRVAPELYLKELLVGGFEKVYELGKSFRNEGIDATHTPEFTTIEWYAAYWDEEDMMACVERLMVNILKQAGVKGGKVVFDGKSVAFGKKFSRLAFTEVLKRYALIVDYEAETPESLRQRARQFGIEVPAGASKGKAADEIFKKICRPHLVQPTFVIHHPLDISPLAKRTAPGAKSVRRLQLIAGGLELVNAYSELNDPRDQRARFEERHREWRPESDEDIHPKDEAFIEALEYGMPPAAGAGIGIDRLVMLLTDARNIREVVLFPTLRPK